MLGLATGAFYRGEPREMRTWARRASDAAPEDPVLQAEADACLGHGALWDADAKLAARAIDRATARLRAIDDDVLAARIACAHHVAGAEMAAERFADAAATTTRGLAIARRTQQGQPLVALLIYRAGALANLLELDQARRDIDAAEECARLQRIPQLLAFALWQRALIHHAQRAAPHANRDAAEFAELAASLEPGRLVTTGLCSTATINADEDPERCLDTILRVAGPELQQALPGWWAALLLTMVRCALALDRHKDAHRWTALAHQHATRMRLPASHVRSVNARAELLLATGQPRASKPRPRCSRSRPTPAAATRDGCTTPPRASCAGSAPASTPNSASAHAPNSPALSPPADPRTIPGAAHTPDPAHTPPGHALRAPVPRLIAHRVGQGDLAEHVPPCSAEGSPSGRSAGVICDMLHGVITNGYRVRELGRATRMRDLPAAPPLRRSQSVAVAR